jgi:hypothetical protein
MTLAEFENFLDLYGGNLDSWPEALRLRAEALLQASAPARAAYDAMREVEFFLNRPVAPAAGYELIAARAMGAGQIWAGRPLAVKAAWSTAAAAILVLGLFIGQMSQTNPDDDPSTALASALASTDTLNVD